MRRVMGKFSGEKVTKRADEKQKLIKIMEITENERVSSCRPQTISLSEVAARRI